jgi:hypothetical protein
VTESPGSSQEERSAERTSRARNSAALEDLIAANEDSNRTMLNLVETVRQETAARDRKVDALEKSQRQMHWLVIMACVLSVIFLVIAVFNAFNLNANRDTNRTVLDCVNGTGNCGRQNALNQKAVLDEVKKFNLIGFYCIRNNPAAEDPHGERFLMCMKELYPGGPSLPPIR